MFIAVVACGSSPRISVYGFLRVSLIKYGCPSPSPCGLSISAVALVNISRSCTVLHARSFLRELIVEIVRLETLRRGQRVERALCEVLISELQRAPAMPTAIDLPIDRRALAVAHAVMDNAGAPMCH